jgi:urease accessory protein
MPPIVRIEKYADRDLAKAELPPLGKLVLSFDLRRKSRLRATLTNGTEAAIFLPPGSVLRDGDLLEAEDGTLVESNRRLKMSFWLPHRRLMN